MTYHCSIIGLSQYSRLFAYEYFLGKTQEEVIPPVRGDMTAVSHKIQANTWSIITSKKQPLINCATAESMTYQTQR